MAHVKKQAVLYVLYPNTQYECRDCNMFIAGKNRCTIHGKNDVIRPHGSCGFMIKGNPHPMEPMGVVTKAKSGYTENEYKKGFSCKRCAAWIEGSEGCKVVDKTSPGDTPERIVADACCNAWEPHPVRSMT